MEIINTQGREYLTTKKIADFGGVAVHDYYDNIGEKHCYIVTGFTQEKMGPALDLFVMLRANPEQNIASIAGDSILYCKNEDIIVFRNTPASTIRSAIFHDDAPHPYTMAFKTAEFHTYFSLTNHETGEVYTIGVSPVMIGSLAGHGYVRDDTRYDSRYYRGDELITPGTKNTMIDHSSLAIQFDLTRQQVLHLEKFVHYTASWWQHPDGESFNFLFRNCSNFVAEAFKTISYGMSGAPQHYYAYAILDELDFMDKGVFYNFMVAYPDDWFSHFDLIHDIVFLNLMHPVEYEVTRGGSWIEQLYPHARYNFIDEDTWFSQEEIAYADELYNIYPSNDVIQDYSIFLP